MALRAIIILIGVLLSSIYQKYLVLGLQRPTAKLAAVVPIVILNCSIPFWFDRVAEFIRRGCFLLVFTWLANFKTIGAALGRGPLCQSLSFHQFTVTYVLPVTPRLKESSVPFSNKWLERSAGSKVTLAAKCAVKLLLLLASVHILSNYELPKVPGEIAKAFCLYWFLGVLMDGPGSLIEVVADLQVAPHFNAPYFSRSISEFWSLRWNLTVGYALRFLIYDPIHEGRLFWTAKPYKHRQWQKSIAVCSAFLVSGLMHEYVLWCLESSAVTGDWLLFFALQGPIVIAESCVRKWAAKLKLRAPGWLSILYTFSSLLLMGHIFFFPPAIDSRLDQRFFSSIRGAFSHYL